MSQSKPIPTPPQDQAKTYPAARTSGGGTIQGLDRRTFALGCGGLGLLILIALALIALFLPPFNLASVVGLGGWQTLNANNPKASHPNGLTVTWTGGESLRVRLSIASLETLAKGQDALPAGLEIQSPLYVIDRRGAGSAIVEVALPANALSLQTLDLYSWDAQTGQWVFVPGHVDTAAGVIRPDALPPNIAVFQAEAAAPLISTLLEEGHSLDEATASALNVVMPVGLEVQADGSLAGAPVGGWQPGAGYAVMPVLRAAEGTSLSGVLNSPADRALLVQDLHTLAVSSGFHGFTLDYPNLAPADREAFVQLIRELTADLHSVNKMVAVILPPPSGGPGAWDTGAYDWRAIGVAADIVIVSPGINPTSYAVNGEAMDLLAWAVGEVSRYKLLWAFPAQSVDETNNVLLGYTEAIALLGEVELTTPLPDDAAAFTPGTELAFQLGSEIGELVADQNTGAYVYTLNTEGGPRRIWIVTANAVRARLDMASAFNIAGMVVNGLGALDNDPGLLTAINEFKVRTVSSVPSQLIMQWTVSDASGVLLNERTGLGTPWAWRADAAGDYIVRGEVIGSAALERGTVEVRVGELPTLTPTPTPTRQAPNPTGAAPAPTGTAPPVAPGGGSGGFELGGQVPGYISHPNEMHSAGMTWVKFQAKWSPGMDPGALAGYVSAGHGAGFKVLLSITGPLYPSSIDYNAYVEFLRGVASYGPDAIEVWNEMNLNREWPSGQIDPANYVNNMLAPAFNAIKSVSPNTMVIIGALAPTGVDDGVNVWSDQRYVQGLAAAGAARYANCIGVHHNAGTTSPSARSGAATGSHYSWYFLPTLEVYYYGMGGALPVCLTEYGYVSPEGFDTPLPSNFSWGADNTVAEQAAWLAEGVDIAQGLGYVRLMIIFNVGFTTWTADDPQGGYSIIRPDGSCPACSTLAAAMGS